MWVDAEEDGVKAVEAAGVKAILVGDLDDALRKLADFTGVQVQNCRSHVDFVSHSFDLYGLPYKRSSCSADRKLLSRMIFFMFTRRPLSLCVSGCRSRESSALLQA